MAELLMTALTGAILVIGIALIRAELDAGVDELFASYRTPLDGHGR